MRLDAATPALLDFQQISVMRDDKLALDRLSLRVGVGEHVAILGPNGCGKSTLIKTITRECYPMLREGSSARILGHEVWDIFQLRSQFGIVSPDLMTACTREITGLEVVLSGFFSCIGSWPYYEITDTMREKAERTMKRLGALHLADRTMTEMSSGEARRMLIGRALVHEPSALLLDEPSTALDLLAQQELRETLRGLARSGIGIVLVTHHLADIIPEMQRVLMLRDGHIIADGDKRELLTVERLTDLFGVPVQLARNDGYYHAW
jgi:iron complex transport system ATP-binding protein